MQTDRVLRTTIHLLANRDPQQAREIILDAMKSRAGRAFAKPDILTVAEWAKLVTEAKENADLTALLHSAMHEFPSPPRCRAIASVAFARGDYEAVLSVGKTDGDVAQVGNLIQLAKDYRLRLTL